MTFYEIVEDPYVMGGRAYEDKNGKRVVDRGDITFTHSVLRADGSRVFRAQTLYAAERLQARLFAVHTERLAA